MPGWADWLRPADGRYTRLGPMSPRELTAPLPTERLRLGELGLCTIDAGPRDAGTPLLFVHGLSAWMQFWKHQLPALSADHRVLALDLPGFGASDSPDAPYTPPWFADVLRRLLDAKGIDRVDLVGHSMGGQIGLQLALDCPDRVRRLALVAPAGLETFNPAAVAMMKAFWTEGRAAATPEAEVRRNMVSAVFARTDDDVERLIEERVRIGQHPRFRLTSRAVARSIHGMLDHPLRHRLGEISAPVLLAVGGRDALIPNRLFSQTSLRALVDDAVRDLPRAEVVWLDDAGHTAHHDMPAAFNRALRRFVETP